MGAKEIVVRSNWEAYLKDFAMAMELSNQYDDDSTNDNDNDKKHSTIFYTTKGRPEPLDPKLPAWTNFEQKYFTVGETCYQITFQKNKTKQ